MSILSATVAGRAPKGAAPKALRGTVRVLLCALLLAPVGFAQGFYFGATLGTPLSGDFGSITDTFELGAQVGFDPVPGFGVRVSAEGNPFNGGLELASADALFRFFLPLTANSFYTGVGADALFAEQPTSLDALRSFQPVLHALGGFELRLSSFGLFAEAQPSYLIGQDFTDSSAYYVRLRGGINVRF